ncbi:6,7-dimethyl-8-ribityllumazine synthase [Candidatus Poriferisodalis sp.]|uniref:6,7-dimethyl-8-ribityllumazine synthase n=1 Tax=Candidatus Poriferisodalis sp. TaxID=3101277 RepID=UPI003B019291
MASGDQRAGKPPAGSGAGLRVGIVRAAWNSGIVDRLAAGVQRGLADLGVCETTEVSVPGCFEIPLAAQMLARSGRVDAIVAIGAVIRGDTTHYELVSEGAASGLMAVQLATEVPIGFGLVTVENHQQALVRSYVPRTAVAGDAAAGRSSAERPKPAPGPGEHNVGEEAACVAVTMALLARDIASADSVR